jgi:hypothetical protein
VKVRALFEDDAQFSCSAGSVLIVGVLLPRSELVGKSRSTKRPLSVVDARSEEPAAKRPEVAAPKRAIAKVAPRQKDSPKVAPASPKVVPSSPKQLPGSPKPALGSPKVALGSPKLSPGSPKVTPGSPKVSPASPAQGGNYIGRFAAEPVAAAPANKKKVEAQPIAHRVRPSGLAYDVLKAGTGAIAQRARPARVRYEGKLAKTGETFDKSEIKFRLGLGEVIRAWDEGIQGMLVGERRRLYVPSRLGYGAEGRPPAIPAFADLIFEVELLQC